MRDAVLLLICSSPTSIAVMATNAGQKDLSAGAGISPSILELLSAVLLHLPPAWAETLARTPVLKASSTAEQNQISISCCLDPTNFCRPTWDGDRFGCACHVDHPQVFFLSCSSVEVLRMC